MKSVTRRTGIAACCGWAFALYLGSAAAMAQDQTWDFQVLLDDAVIGHQSYVLRDTATGRELKTEARFEVRVLFIPAYRYTHQATERWRGNCLVGLHARTDDDGERSAVSAEQQDRQITVTTAQGSQSVAGCVMSFAYWNPEILGQTRLLNTQTGKFETVTVAALGSEKIVARGASVVARRYRITGPKHPIDLWYGADQQWLALQSTLDKGRILRYQLK